MLYFAILFLSFAGPFALSFDKKLQFYKQWKFLFPSLLITAIVYIAGDILMTRAGHWGFDPRYHSGLLISDLPVEEWLFFLIIPYSSVFLHDVVVFYFPSFRTSVKTGRILRLMLILIFLSVAILFFHKAYTIYSALLMIVALLFSLAGKPGLMDHYWVTYLFILVPFTLVNGILTGSLIDGEVVWYSEQSITGYRFLTIPVEDFGYGFSLVLFVLLLREQFISRFGEGNRPGYSKSTENE